MYFFKFFCLSIIFLFSSSVYSKSAILIDSELKKYDVSMKQKSSQCMKIQDFMDQTDCLNKVTDDTFDAPIRGTKEYCKNNYLNKSFKEREAILKKLKNDQKQSRTLAMRGIDRKPGEVTAEMLQTEILIVEDSLAKNQRSTIKKTRFDLFGR